MNKLKLVFPSLLFLSKMCSSAFATPIENAFNEGSQHGAEQHEKTTSTVINTSPSTIPAFETDSPPESTYSPESLESKGTEHVASDPTAQQVGQNYYDKEAVGKDPLTDPVAAIARKSVEQADIIAGDAAICLEEKCFDENYERATDDLAPSISEFSVAIEGGHSYSEHKEDQPDWLPDQFYSVQVYRGGAHDCEISSYGYSNCCQDSGWGQDVGLARCSAAEKQLGEMKQQGLCHYVGDYEDGDWWNKKEYKGYCCFSSKLARLTHEDGRPQIGLSWGSGENPNCRGFTEEEFQSLNFEEIDLTEYYEDIENSMVIPDPDEFIERAEEAAEEQANQKRKQP